MTIRPIRFSTPSFDPPLPAQPQPVAAVTPPLAQDNPQHGPGTGLHHPHKGHRAHGHEHPPGHGPTPRPRRNTSLSRPQRRRRRVAAAVDDDEGNPCDAEQHTVSVGSVGFRDEHPDGSNEQDEGEHERSRHERLSRVRGHRSEGARGKACERSPVRPDTGAFADAVCKLVAAWRPGEHVGLEIQRAKLALLKSGSAAAPADGGGLARVAQRLRAHMPERSGPGSPTLNLMLPILLLMMEQLARTPSQRTEAIARTEVSILGHANGRA